MTATNRFSLYIKRSVRIFAVSLAIILLLSASVLLSYAATESSASGGLDVEITLDKENYSAGESVTVMLSITNNTGKKIENVSARYFVPECLEISDSSITEIGALNSRQTVRTQIQAVAKTDVGSSFEDSLGEKDNTTLYIILIVISAAVFLLSLAFLFIREKNRRKIAATISFVFALIFCLSTFASAVMPVSADTSDMVFADDMTYENAKHVIGKLIPNDYTKINPLIASGNPLTRESAAVISAIMILGKNGLPEITDDPFLDVSAESASAPYIMLSASHDIVPSISANRFDPTASVSGYDFVRYVLRAAGFGENGEYKGQNARARVIADALSLPYTDASELLTDEPISCSKALCFALSVMLNPSVEKNENGEYAFTRASLISEFDGVTEKKALAVNKNALVTENGERIDVPTKTIGDVAYTVTFLGDSALTLTKDFSNLGYSIIPVYASGKSHDLGVGIEYTIPAPKSEYIIYRGSFRSDDSVFTCDNIHYSVSEKAFDGTVYMLDAKISDKSLIDYAKTVIFIAKVEKDSAIKNISRVLYVYQLSSDESASYDAFNTALSAARDINNDKNTFMPSAYEKFVSVINSIDQTLPRDLTDTQESRDIIAQAEADIRDAINTLDKYLLESYDELDKEIELAEKELEKEGEYTEDSFNALKAALAEAKALSRELLLSDESKALIKASKDALSKSISSLKPSAYCNYTAYKQTLETALKINNDDGKYNATEFSNFKKNVNNIDKELDKELAKSDANQRRVDNACAAIQDAIERLNSKLPCDYSALDSAIREAEKLVENDTSNATHKWKSGAFSAFVTALNDAKGVKRGMTLGYGSTNQQTINGAATTLFNATDVLKANENDKFDMTAFENALTEAKKLENDGSYSEEAFALLQGTISNIEKNIDPLRVKATYVCSKDGCTCDAKVVQKAISDIAAAKELKDPKPCDYEKLDEKITEIGGIDRTLYTPKSLGALDTALDAAHNISRTLLGDVLGENQKLINDTAKALDDAVKSLVKIEYIVTEVVSEVEKKQITDDGGSIIEQYFIKVIFDGKEKEFLLDPSISARPAARDIIILSFAKEDAIAIEIAKVSYGTFEEGATLKDIKKHISSYKASEPNTGDSVVFFKSSADEIIFITLPEEKIAEIIYSESKLIVAGKEVPVAESSNFSTFTEKTLVKVMFTGRYALSAEPLTAVDVTLSLNDDKKVVYKEGVDGEDKALEASKTVFEADADSALLTLDQLTSALKAEDAVKSYTAKIYLDTDGKLIASSSITAVNETPAPEQGNAETT